MKICIFFDGQNFYRSLLRYDETLRVDYDRLAVWITQTVGGPGGVFWGIDRTLVNVTIWPAARLRMVRPGPIG